MAPTLSRPIFGLPLEVGTPFNYEPYVWKENFKDPGY